MLRGAAQRDFLKRHLKDRRRLQINSQVRCRIRFRLLQENPFSIDPRDFITHNINIFMDRLYDVLSSIKKNRRKERVNQCLVTFFPMKMERRSPCGRPEMRNSFISSSEWTINRPTEQVLPSNGFVQTAIATRVGQSFPTGHRTGPGKAQPTQATRPTHRLKRRDELRRLLGTGTTESGRNGAGIGIRRSYRVEQLSKRP